jgi:hypothetical protein
MVNRAAIAALNFISLNTNRQSITTYAPNQGAVFCNKYPKEELNTICKPLHQRLHVLAENRLISFLEIKLENGLYDILSIVRNSMGIHAYRAQLVYSLRQIAETLSQNETETQSEDNSFVIPALAPDKFKETIPPNKLVINRPTSVTFSSPDEKKVIYQCMITF